MTERVKATGESLNAALRSAIADMAQTDESKVEVRIEAPGFDADAIGDVKLRVEFAAAGSEDDDHSQDGADDHDDADAEHRRSSPSTGGGESELTAEDLDAEADAAADFIESLLDAMELPGDLQIRLHEDHAEIEIVNVGSGALIGRRGSTLEALQELVRSALQREFQRRARVQIDIEGYRARRLERLLEKAEEAIDEVLDTGEAVRLEPMDVFERKRIHHLVAEVEGVNSRSQGREPGRRVIIEPED